MKLLKSEVLSQRALTKAKFQIGVFCCIGLVQLVAVAVAQRTFMYQGVEYAQKKVSYFERGRITAFTSLEEFCDSSMFVPGWTLLSRNTLTVLYILMFAWLCLGINAISDIFMVAIENITSSKREVTQTDPYSGLQKTVLVPVWNPTLANLTLMAFGSSAPEIFLSVIETVSTLGSKPGELGPSTIVGSAAFNFLVISAVSILSVNAASDTRTEEEIKQDGTDRGIKKIDGLVVFAITTTWSIVAYIWLFIVLSDKQVSTIEGVLTLTFFFILLAMAYIADCMRASRTKELEVQKFGEVSGMSVVDFYEKLIPQEKGIEPSDEAERKQIQQMKEFLQRNFGTANISSIDKDKLKVLLGGEHIVERISYRKKVAISGFREAIEKGEIIRRQNKSAEEIDEKDKNSSFGFSCLHYSVSEGAGVIKVKIVNKSKLACSVRVRSRQDTATEDEDYEKVDKVLEFNKDEGYQEINVKIHDDEEWEPDEDFFLDLYDAKTNSRLIGGDTTTKITIIDDDKPGDLVFEEKRSLKHPANQNICRVRVNRINGSDGPIKVNYRTVELDKSDKTAIEGKHFTGVKGVLEFEANQIEKTIEIPILQIKDDEENDVQRDEIFALKLEDPIPEIVKISKKDMLIIEIVTDAQSKNRADALQQLLDRINKEENITWGQQFIEATLLHPKKGEDGEIIEISNMDAFLHLASIGWKFLFALCPPPHIWGGWACFIVAIIFIGGLTAVVGQVAGALGCVMGIPPGVTAITFVAIGTSLPDTFASRTAAIESRFADSAVGNVTGSNSVNVFLGLGLPWVIAVIYSNQNGQDYYEVPAKGLTLSVVMFLACCLIGVALLVVRRMCVGGELGGSAAGRWASFLILVGLWLAYVVVCTLAQLGYIPDDFGGAM